MTTIASISFTDALGAVVVTNTKPVPGDRFTNWNPDSDPVGPTDVGLGTGLIHQFSFRDDYLVSFDIDAIPNTEFDKLLRLQTHLLDGYLVAVACENVMADVFALCSLAPGTAPQITMTDVFQLEYSLRVKLLAVNPATVPGDEPFYPPGVSSGVADTGNDSHSTPYVLPPGTAGETICVNGDNTGATLEDGEESLGQGQTLWFKWVAPFRGKVSFDTWESVGMTDTILAAYHGESFGSVDRVAFNDDSSGHGALSKITFSCEEGETYYIMVGGYGSDEGSFRLCYTPSLRAPVADFSWTYIAERKVTLDASLGARTGYSAFNAGTWTGTYGVTGGCDYGPDATFRWEFLDAGSANSDATSNPTSPAQSADDTTSGAICDHQFDVGLFMFAHQVAYAIVLGWFGLRHIFEIRLTVTDAGGSSTVSKYVPTYQETTGAAGPQGGLTSKSIVTTGPDAVTTDWSTTPVNTGQVGDTRSPDPTGTYTLNLSLTDFGVTRSGSVSGTWA